MKALRFILLPAAVLALLGCTGTETGASARAQVAPAAQRQNTLGSNIPQQPGTFPGGTSQGGQAMQDARDRVGF